MANSKYDHIYSVRQVPRLALKKKVGNSNKNKTLQYEKPSLEQA